MRGGNQRRGHQVKPRVKDVAARIGQVIGNAARQGNAGDRGLHHGCQMIERAAERIAVADIDAGVVAQPVGDIHRACAGDGLVELAFLLGFGNDKDVL